jgi:Protein of unknown function (DUF3667)
MNSPAPAEPVPAAGAIAAPAPVAPAEATGEPRATQPPAAGTVCANCGSPLTGRYCSQCGQRHHDHPVHHFWHFVGEATEDLTHADSRLWQTLFALIFRPGLLTREFLEGRRARYLPPVRLYLVVSVIFFLIVGLNSRISGEPASVDYNGKSLQYTVIPAGTASGLAAVPHTPAPVSGAGAGPAAARIPMPAPQHLCEQSGTYVERHGGWLASWGPRVAQSCLATTAEGGLSRLTRAFVENLERAMFLLLPLLALVMKPLYRRPPRYYVEHLLFFLHSQAFLFVLLGLITLLGMIASSAVVLDPVYIFIAIYVPVYFYRAMRRVYGQGRWLTLGKLSTLGVAYSFLCVLMLAATVSYSFLSL